MKKNGLNLLKHVSNIKSIVILISQDKKGGSGWNRPGSYPREKSQSDQKEKLELTKCLQQIEIPLIHFI